ncbi:MAG TPA: type II secretion system F family protein [Terriglobales bacterium]|jgi:tight adherence protein C|nr:type II secretion system F family protein [Terriglobales bacterium]
MLLIISIVVFVTIVLAVLAFGTAAATPSSVLGERLKSLGTQRVQVSPQRQPIRERLEQALDPLSKALPISPTDVSQTRAWLIQAGYRDPKHVTIFYGVRALFAFVALAGVVIFGGAKSPMLLIGIPAFGFFLPRFFLKRMIRDRQTRIRVGLPDALDLTVICVEAGLALDQAMQRVGEDLKHAHKDLSDEFHLVNLEMRAGKPRAEALRNLAERTGVDDIKALVGTLIQTDRFGTSVAQALRVHSDSLRTERRQRAEEQAAKTTIKMIPPLVVFVLPSIMIVSLGPAIIALVRILLPPSGR